MRSPQRVYVITMGSVYPLYVQKAEKKGRTRAEVDTIIRWLTGYDLAALEALLADGTTLEQFYTQAPKS